MVKENGASVITFLIIEIQLDELDIIVFDQCPLPLQLEANSIIDL